MTSWCCSTVSLVKCWEQNFSNVARVLSLNLRSDGLQGSHQERWPRIELHSCAPPSSRYRFHLRFLDASSLNIASGISGVYSTLFFVCCEKMNWRHSHQASLRVGACLVGDHGHLPEEPPQVHLPHMYNDVKGFLGDLDSQGKLWRFPNLPKGEIKKGI